MKKIFFSVLLAVVFGKLFPVVLLALLLAGLGLIVRAAIEEGKEL